MNNLNLYIKWAKTLITKVQKVVTIYFNYLIWFLNTCSLFNYAPPPYTLRRFTVFKGSNSFFYHKEFPSLLIPCKAVPKHVYLTDVHYTKYLALETLQTSQIPQETGLLTNTSWQYDLLTETFLNVHHKRPLTPVIFRD